MAGHVRSSQSLLLTARSRDQESGEDQTATFLQRTIFVLVGIVLRAVPTCEIIQRKHESEI